MKNKKLFQRLMAVVMCSTLLATTPIMTYATTNAVVSEEVLDNSNTLPESWFTYQVLVDGTYGITGLSAEAGDCSELKLPTMYNGIAVTSIQRGAFEANTDIETVVIPEGYTYIGEGAFWQATNISTVYIPASMDDFNSIGGEFAECTGLTTVYYAGTKAQWIEAINDFNGRFMDCFSITVKCSDGDILYNENGQMVGEPNENGFIIEDGVLIKCTKNVSEITIPSGVTTIGTLAFRDCYDLEKVVISEGVTTLEDEAFRDCGGMTSIVIPESVTSIGENVFIVMVGSDDTGEESCVSYAKYVTFYVVENSYAHQYVLDNGLNFELQGQKDEEDTLDFSWTDAWKVKAKFPEECESARFLVSVYNKEGSYITSNSGDFVAEDADKEGYVYIDMTDYFYFDMENVIGVTSWLMESGEYYAKVTVCPQGEELIIGETPLQEYIAPSEQLPIPVNIAFDENGVLSFELVEGAVLYKVSVDGKTPNGDNVYLDLAGGAEYFTNEHSKDGKTITWDIEKCIEESRPAGDKGYYDKDINFTVTIQAFSGDINTIRHSGISEGIVYEYIYFKSQDIALNDFNKALEDEDVEYAIDVLQKVNNEMLMEMLQTDADFAKEVKDLEIKYQNEHNITVTSKSEVEVVDASKVSIVGGVLNAPVDFRPSVVELSIKTPANAVEVPAKYSNGLPLDITLLIDENAQENLRVPVTITMPIPSGVSKEKLVILHYHANSTEPAVLTPVINADDTMTFIVDGFSTFVVANDISETSGDGNDSSNDTGNSDNNGNDSSDDTGNSDNNGNDNSNDTGNSDNNGNSNSNDNEGNSGDKSPDTGDSAEVFSIIALVMSVLLLVTYKKMKKA